MTQVPRECLTASLMDCVMEDRLSAACVQNNL